MVDLQNCDRALCLPVGDNEGPTTRFSACTPGNQHLAMQANAISSFEQVLLPRRVEFKAPLEDVNNADERFADLRQYPNNSRWKSICKKRRLRPCI